ncbi:MAG: TIR domain-containing protein [Candidatus Sulfotelmatobacter sp.]
MIIFTIVHKSETITRLESLIGRIDSLAKVDAFDEDFQKWRHDVRAALKNTSPGFTECLETFDAIEFSPNAYSRAQGFLILRPYSFDHVRFRRGLKSARALLRSLIEQLQNAGPNELATSSNTPERRQPTNPETVFVIHGHQLLGEFHDFLRSLGLRPFEWSQARGQTGKPNPFTWEIVDHALRGAGAVVALMTPDDEACLRKDLWSENMNALEKQLLFQPRQNVLFEAGVAFGRAPDRTVLIQVGQHRPMSDLAGHHILHLDNSPQSRRSVADGLRAAGCPVDLSGSDWFSAGNFAL